MFYYSNTYTKTDKSYQYTGLTFTKTSGLYLCIIRIEWGTSRPLGVGLKTQISDNVGFYSCNTADASQSIVYLVGVIPGNQYYVYESREGSTGAAKNTAVAYLKQIRY